MKWSAWKTQLRTWLANTVIRVVLNITGTKVMYGGLILETEEIYAVPPDVVL